MAGYSGTPLPKKLGIAEGDRVYVGGNAPDGFLDGDIAVTETTLVDNKVCAIDDTWSGPRLVVRVKDRAAWPVPGSAEGRGPR